MKHKREGFTETNNQPPQWILYVAVHSRYTPARSYLAPDTYPVRGEVQGLPFLLG